MIDLLNVDLLNVAVNSVMRSALYALVAIGFTLIFGVGGVLNLAHGASITVGAFAAVVAVNALQLGVVGAVAAAVVVPALFGAVLYLVLIRPVEDEPIMVMILTLVTAVAIEQVILTTFGGTDKALPALVSGQFPFAGSRIQWNLVVVFALSWAVIGGLFLFVNYTRTGKAVLATSMSPKGAALVGIDAERIALLTWVLAGALAGLAGLFLGSQQTAGWQMGRTPLVISFSIVVVGGIGSIRGSVVGAYLIGTLEVATTTIIDSSLTGLTPLLVLVAVLLIKPEGLFGRELVEG